MSEPHSAPATAGSTPSPIASSKATVVPQMPAQAQASPPRAPITSTSSSASSTAPHSTPSSIPPFPFAATEAKTAAAVSTVAAPALPPVIPALASVPASSFAGGVPLFSPPPLPPSLGASNAAAGMDLGGAGFGINSGVLTTSAMLATNLAALANFSLASLSPAELLFKARLALQAERFDEMAAFMRALVSAKGNVPLTLDERGMLALAFKKLLAPRRAGWRFLYSIELKERGVRKKLEGEIARETEREQSKLAQAAAAAAAAQAQARMQAEQESKEAASNGASTAASASLLADPSRPKPAATSASGNGSAAVVPPAAMSSSVLPALQARLAQVTLQLSHIHAYRYRLFYEAALLIHEVATLLTEKLLPNLLPQHAGLSQEVFTRSIPAIIELCVGIESKRGGRRDVPQAQQPAAQPPTQPQQQNESKAADGSTNIAPLLAAPGNAATAQPTPASAAPAPATPALVSLLPPTARWSLEAELELQLRALDAQTRFVSGLRSGPAPGSNGANNAAAASVTTGSQAESAVFYLKLLADHRRLLAEFLSEREYESHERSRQSLLALCYYLLARYIALQALPASSPVRLGLSLNHALFLHEVMAQPDRACQLAKNAYDQALQEHKGAHAAAAAAASTSSAAGAASSSGAAVQGSAAGTVAGVSSASSATSSSGVSSSVSASPSTSAVGGASGGLLLKDSLLLMQLLKSNLSMWSEAT